MKINVPLFFICLSLICLSVSAQNEAIPFYSSGGLTGYATNGAGFMFVPQVPIEVTALGFGGSDLTNYPYQVSLYNQSGSQLATAQVTTGSSFNNQTYYDFISPVFLPAFSTNYIGAVQVGNPSGDEWVGNLVGTFYGGSFSVNPDISYLHGAVDFVSGVPTGLYGDYFFADENFQFTVVPEPPVLSLGITGLLGIILYRRRGRFLRSS